MDNCESCKRTLPFFTSAFPYAKYIAPPEVPPSQVVASKSSLLSNAFSTESRRNNSEGLAVAVENAVLQSSDQRRRELVNARSYYFQRAPNCFVVAMTSGVRGAVVGSVFGGAMGLSTAVQSGYKGSAAFSYAGYGALRNAGAFGSWTATYGFTRCSCIHLRGRDDMLNAVVAGAFTGGVLTLISKRGYWRYYQREILTNAAGSAMIAVMFNALNQM